MAPNRQGWGPSLRPLRPAPKVPPFEEFELATASLFDFGVFLTVLGAVMLMLYSLSRLARYAGETVNEEPMDYDPSRRVEVARIEEQEKKDEA
mgnify:CR=1 FL=1